MTVAGGPGTILPGFWILSMAGNQPMPSWQLPAINVTIGPNATKQSRKLVGMLDTGADLCRIDEGLASKLKAGSSIKSSLSGVNIDCPMYQAVLKVPGLDFTFSGEFPVNAFRKSGQMFDVLLGQDFLRFFNLSIRGKDRSIEAMFLGVT